MTETHATPGYEPLLGDEERLNAIRDVGITIAIDGPAGSGKSTVSKRVASSLGIGYLDTGAMYRALTVWALDKGVDLSDHDAVRALADDMPLVMESDPYAPRFWLGDTEITATIREPRISEAVSHVATNLAVRAWMATEQRRRMIDASRQGSGMIAEGRDITTVVFPDADVRVLLTADNEARLRRRTLELYGEVTPELLEATRKGVEERDQKDSTVSEFMTPAPGVHLVDSSHLTIDGVVEAIVALADQSLIERRSQEV